MEIANHIHLLEETKGSYVYVILGEEPVLVDTFFPGRSDKVIEGLRKIGLEPTDIAHIVLTHHDVDHVGNARVLRDLSGATLWAPKEDIPLLRREQADKGFRRVIKAMMKVEVPEVDRVYEQGMRIGNVEIIPSPGHTPGHVCAHVDDVLIAGDLVTTRNGKLKPSPGFLTYDKAALKRSLREVGSLRFDWICPAHGEPVQRGNLWDALIRP